MRWPVTLPEITTAFIQDLFVTCGLLFLQCPPSTTLWSSG